MISLEERSLAERLQRRIAVEEEFARTGRTFREKPFLIQHEDVLIRPVLKAALKLAGLYSRGLRNALNPVIRKLTLHFDNLPPAFEGFKILHLSDLHIDGVDGLAQILACQLRGLRPDICVITGDYRFENEGVCDEVYPRMRTIISSICAKHGIFGILGNHDSAEIALGLEDMGVRMLINEAYAIEKSNSTLWLAGVDDPFDYRCDDLPAALASIPLDAFKILLAHTPELYEDAARRGVDLYLCGHTHGGQFRLPLIGALRHNANCPKSYLSGQWRHAGMHGYTNAGAGCSLLPLRFNCPPELLLLTLRSN
ncbi:MAG: metallophosphoesterase [Acidobacteriaceae bacterium]|nr:metallophosphoesterase [Acidobacteriaceae bacterium]